MGPKWPKSGVFGHFLELESLVFSDFAYYDRQQWYRAGTGGHCTQKKCPGPKWAHFGPNLAQNGIFSETTIEILVINRQNVEDDSAEQTRKFQVKLYCSSGDIQGHSFWASLTKNFPKIFLIQNDSIRKVKAPQTLVYWRFSSIFGFNYSLGKYMGGIFRNIGHAPLFQLIFAKMVIPARRAPSLNSTFFFYVSGIIMVSSRSIFFEK